MCYISLEREFHGESETVITLFARIEMYVWHLNEKSGPPKIFSKITEKCLILSIFWAISKKICEFLKFEMYWYYSVNPWL